MTVKWGEKWNSWNLMKLDRENQQKNLFNSIKSQSLWIKLPSFQTYRSFSSSQRPTHRLHRPQERGDLLDRTHTYQLLWIPRAGYQGNWPSCTPWNRDSSGAWQACESPWVSYARASQTQPTWHKTRHTHRSCGSCRRPWSEKTGACGLSLFSCGDDDGRCWWCYHGKAALVSFGTMPFVSCGPRAAWSIATNSGSDSLSC